MFRLFLQKYYVVQIFSFIDQSMLFRRKVTSILFTTILEPLLPVAKAYPNANEIITTAKTGPVNGGNIFELVIIEYDSIAAIPKAAALNAYGIYLNALV